MGAERFVVGTFHVQRFAPYRYGPGGRVFALGESFAAKELVLGGLPDDTFCSDQSRYAKEVGFFEVVVALPYKATQLLKSSIIFHH